MPAADMDWDVRAYPGCVVERSLPDHSNGPVGISLISGRRNENQGTRFGGG
jgi:hypothetical protein